MYELNGCSWVAHASIAGLSWREVDSRGGGIAPVCRKGPDRAEVDPFEFVRAIGGAGAER